MLSYCETIFDDFSAIMVTIVKIDVNLFRGNTLGIVRWEQREKSLGNPVGNTSAGHTRQFYPNFHSFNWSSNVLSLSDKLYQFVWQCLTTADWSNILSVHPALFSWQLVRRLSGFKRKNSPDSLSWVDIVYKCNPWEFWFNFLRQLFD